MKSEKVDLNQVQATIFKELLSGEIDYQEAARILYQALLKYTDSQYGYLGQLDYKKNAYNTLPYSSLHWDNTHAMPLSLPLEAEIKQGTEKRRAILLKGLKQIEEKTDETYSCWVIPLHDNHRTLGILCLAQKGDQYPDALNETIAPFTEILRLLLYKVRTTAKADAPRIAGSKLSFDSPEILKEAIHLSDLGIWMLSLKEHKIFCSPGLYKILERELPENPPDFDEFMQFIPAPKREQIKAQWLMAEQKKGKNTFKHQFLMPDGTNKEVEIVCEAFSFKKRSKNSDFILGSCRDISDYIAELKKKRRFDKVLLQLSKAEELQQGNIEQYLKQLLRTASGVLDTQRVSIWTFNDHYKEIQCYQLYDCMTETFAQGEILRIKNYPHYFEALLNSRSLSVIDAREDQRTVEFTENYLQKYNIYSMLDTQIWHSGKIYGIFCVEHTGSIRQWTQNEESFAASLSEFISLAFGAQQRNDFTKALQESEEKYRELFEGTPSPLMLVDNYTFDILDVNEAAVEEYGYSYDEFKKLKIWDIRPHSEVDKLRKKLTSPRPVKENAGVWLHQRKDNSLFFADIIVHQIELGGRLCTLSHVQNITAQIEAHEKNEVLISNLRDIATLTSHELRGPLARILGLVSIFDQEERDKLTNAEVVKRLRKEAKALDHIISRMVRKTEEHDDRIHIKKSS